MGICQVGIGPTVGQRCVPNTNGPIVAQRWSSTGPHAYPMPTDQQQPNVAQCMHAI